jgi:hypothetical protein
LSASSAAAVTTFSTVAIALSPSHSVIPATTTTEAHPRLGCAFLQEFSELPGIRRNLGLKKK